MDPLEYRLMYQAENHLWWYQGMEQISRQVLQRFCTSDSKLKILDAGCGTGGTTRYLQEYGEVTGLDLSSHALALARTRNLSRLVQGSLTALPFPGNSFNLITSFDVICVLDPEAEQLALTELHRVLGHRGWLFLRLPACNWIRGAHDAAVSVRHRYSCPELQTKLAKLGFQCEWLSYANMWLLPVAVLKRWGEKFLPCQPHSDLSLNFKGLNSFFSHLLSSEASIIRHSRLPFGLTAMALARKV